MHNSIQALFYVEIDLPRCSLTYGSAPCTAAIDITGERKCFNSLKTCQDTDNYTETTEVLRLARPTSFLPIDIPCLPYISSIDFTPAMISLGNDLGQRASIKIKCQDHPHSDIGPGGDRYVDDRDYNPWFNGTFFGRFRSRFPYLRGKEVRLIFGYVGQTLEEMEHRYYILDSISGPTRSGEFTFVVKDMLKLADGDRSVAPVLSNGYLNAAISSSDTSLTLSPSGIGDLEYPSSGKVAVGGKEIMAFTRSGDVLTITRAQYNTEAVAHDAQDRVQLCLEYLSESPADIIRDLFVTYSSVKSTYINLNNWQSEIDDFLGVVYSALICEPTSVSQLISELVTQAALVVWWNDSSRQIGLQVLRNISIDAALYDDNVILQKTLDISDQPEKRLSRVHVYFGQINPLKTLSDLDNYRSSVEVVDSDAEEQYGISIKQITSRWIAAFGRTVAETAARKLVARYRDIPRKISFDLPRYSVVTTPTLALGCRVSAQPFQDATGARELVPIQLVEVDFRQERYVVVAEEMLFTSLPDAPVDRIVVIGANTNNFNLRTAYDLSYPAPQSGDEIYCRLDEGVIVGATSPAVPAFDVGSWPSGVTLVITVNGRIEGAGGDGGNGQTFGQPVGDGEDGGVGLYTRQAVTIVYGANAEVWGGGGGGGGGGSGTIYIRFGGGGGGGGGGQVPGIVGANGASVAVTVAGTDGTTEAGGNGTQVDVGGSGGDGGDPGNAGSSGAAGGGFGGSGGAAGAAIDGVSYITVDSGSADVRGSTIN